MEKLHKIIVVFILCLTICILGGCVKGETISSIKNEASPVSVGSFKPLCPEEKPQNRRTAA